MQYKQRGFSLLGVLLGLGVAASVAAIALEMQHRQFMDDLAAEAGTDLASLALGMRGFIAAAQNNPAIIPGGVIAGTNWLKPPSCGGAATNPAQGYIPCAFPSYNGFDTPFGVSFSTQITRDAATNLIVARTTYIPTNIPLARRAAIASRVAVTASRQDASPATGLFTLYLSNVPTAADGASGRNAVIGNTANANFGRVLAVVNNAPSNDIYLRTVGTNSMLGALNMGGQDIVNAKDITATGNVSADGTLNVGQGIGVSSGDVTLATGNLKTTNSINGDGRGIVIADDVHISDMTNGFGVTPRMSQAVFDVQVKSNWEGMGKPSCPTGLGNPQIFASIQDISLDSGEPIHGSRIIAVDMGTWWQVRSEALSTTSGWQVSSAASKMVVMTKCL